MLNVAANRAISLFCQLCECYVFISNAHPYYDATSSTPEQMGLDNLKIG